MTLNLTSEELALALRRVERDHQYGRVFVTRLSEWIVLRSGREQWLKRLHDDLANGTYNPAPAQVADVPKGKGAVRAACLLTLADEVVFTLVVGQLLPAIEGALTWQHPHPDCSYVVRSPKEPEWLSNPFVCFDRFRKRSIGLLEANIHFVVTTDITGYYDAILHEVLLSELNAAGADPQVSRYLIGKLLSRWAMVNSRGIPQGLSASDLLAKLYLNTVDRALSEAGFVHLRYVDDFRLFCAASADAQKALLQLQLLLRRRGLALQSAKTEILRPDRARMKFDGIQPVLAPLAKKFRASIAAAAGIASDYLPPKEAAKVLASLKSPPTDLLRDAYTAYFTASDSGFDKTLFHFLLGQLGRARDPFAAPHCIRVLADHPEEMEKVLTYLGNTAALAEHEAALLGILKSADAIYPYQHYQYLHWRVKQAQLPAEPTLKYARDIVASQRSPGYLVAAARLFLGRFGSDADLEQIRASYAGAEADGARVDIVCSLYRMEPMQRNSFLGTVKNDGLMVARAAAAVKEGKVTLDIETQSQ